MKSKDCVLTTLVIILALTALLFPDELVRGDGPYPWSNREFVDLEYVDTEQDNMVVKCSGYMLDCKQSLTASMNSLRWLEENAVSLHTGKDAFIYAAFAPQDMHAANLAVLRGETLIEIRLIADSQRPDIVYVFLATWDALPLGTVYVISVAQAEQLLSGISLAPHASLGEVIAATSLDRNGCAASRTSVFGPDGPIYVVAESSDVEAGTDVFVRLYFEGEPIEDLPEITADQDYSNVCINFVFEPTTGAQLASGDYRAEFIVNGVPSGSVTLRVQQ